ncbi:MAG: MBL fold metallo-hydrolase [Peptococcaceae bacterium]|jgi:glyoxylase-like metal-dependent hydrolase (beta-lactamase superfamily II)|nr:MBL fold metallo-hydrolase [Peptococcaceae bacterium]MDH7524418.1 MBL fold metallo-hydrolase [Peptococcaceae bacterium]
MNLHFLTAGSCCLDGAINLGVLVKNKKALLVDSGLDEAAAKKALRILKDNGLNLTGLILTHAHADHTGGAAYLRKTTQIPVIASPREKPLIEWPDLEPFYLFGGAKPLKSMENKFLQASPCPVDICLQEGKQELFSFSLEVIPLPGHTPGQVGIIHEGTFFLADAVFSPEILAKHGLPYHADIGSALQTIERKGLSITNPGQYFLLKASLHAFLSCLANAGDIGFVIKDNDIFWCRC